MSNYSEEALDTIKSLSYKITSKVAPDETEFFDAFFDEYMLVFNTEFKDTLKDGMQKDDFAFVGPDAVQDFLTPTVISAVITGLVKALEAFASKKKPKTTIEMNSTDSNSINFIGVERELYDLLRSRRVGNEKAKSISKEFVALIASDPTIVIKYSESNK